MVLHRIFFILLIISTIFYSGINAQTKIAITLDDVPNTAKYAESGFRDKLLNTLDTLRLPVTIFINEGLLYKNKHVDMNRELLRQWSQREYITLGNHTKNHSRYSAVGFKEFAQDIKDGEYFLTQLSREYKKSLRYFRFPFNDLGENKNQHVQISDYLQKNNYINTPFTVESADYAFNYVYIQYLKNGNTEKAQEIAMTYIDKTIEFFQYFDTLSESFYHRKINQIYLCHDNLLNADYFGVLIKKLKESGYIFVSLDEAMQDPVYKQQSYYYGKYGFSWFYRWLKDKAERTKLMKAEPDLNELYNLYKHFQNHQ